MAEILKRAEFVHVLPHPSATVKISVPRPQDRDYKEAEKLLRRQESLENEIGKLGAIDSEEKDGRRASLERQISKLEMKKHPCLRAWNAHMFPELQKLPVFTLH